MLVFNSKEQLKILYRKTKMLLSISAEFGEADDFA